MTEPTRKTIRFTRSDGIVIIPIDNIAMVTPTLHPLYDDQYNAVVELKSGGRQAVFETVEEADDLYHGRPIAPRTPGAGP